MGQLCSKGADHVDCESPCQAPVAAEVVCELVKAVPKAAPPASPTDSASSVHGAFLSWAQQQSSLQKQPLDLFLISSVRQVAEACCSASSTTSDNATSTDDSKLSVELQQLLEALAAGDSPPEDLDPTPFQPHDGYQLGAPAPACQDQRVLAANAINRLRATKDGEIESVLRLLCTVFDTDTATVALLTGECVYLTGACGGLWPCICPDRWGYCGWSFLNANHELLVIEDMEKDLRFSQNYFVIEPEFHLVFYVAAPLITSDGHRLGTLCIMGQEPRKFDATRAQLLANMAELLVRQLERTWVMQLHEEQQGKHLARSMSVYDSACLFVDVSTPTWRVLHANNPAIEQLGIKWEASYAELALYKDGRRDRHSFNGVDISDIFDIEHSGAKWVSGRWEFTLHGVSGAASAGLGGKVFDLHFRLATSDGLDSEQPFCVGVPSWLSTAGDAFGRSYFFVRVTEASASASSHAHSHSNSHANDHASRSNGGSNRNSMDTPATSEASNLPVPAELQLHRFSSGCGSSGSIDSGSSNAWMPRGLLPLACPVEGLVLGPLLGRGSYGRVYRGVYRGKMMAVKIIDDLASLRCDANGKPLEASLTMGLGHSNVMRTINYAFAPDSGLSGRRNSGGGVADFTGNKCCWMLLEYCDRGCIADAVVKGWFRTSRLPTEGGLNLRAVAVTAYEVASAMAYLHGHDVVHGDLCGGNIMLCSSTINAHGFTAKVGDFGMARQAAVSRCAQPAMYGTATHMPPEALLDGIVHKPTDVYSFGVLLWEMLTSSRAWAGMKHAQIICQVALLKRRLAVPEGLPPVIEDLLVRCLTPAAADCCTFDEIATLLAEFLQATTHEQQGDWRVKLPIVEGAAGALMASPCATAAPAAAATAAPVAATTAAAVAATAASAVAAASAAAPTAANAASAAAPASAPAAIAATAAAAVAVAAA